MGSMAMDLKQGHEWNHGICACDCGACIRSCCCPCTLFGRTSYRLTHRDDVEMKGYHTCNISCVSWCGLCLVAYIGAVTLQALRRCAMRQELGIDGNPVKDACAAFWCQACVLVQDDCEAQDWQKRKGPYAAVQPAQQQGMAYTPQHPPAPAPAVQAPPDAQYGTIPAGAAHPAAPIQPAASHLPPSTVDKPQAPPY